MSKLMITGIKSAYKPPICTSCHKPIPPKDDAVSFYCPECGKVMIWRCSKCRKAGVKYRCPNCGFEGP